MLTAAANHRKPLPLRDGALINKLCPADDGRAAERKPIMKKVNVVFTLRGGGEGGGEREKAGCNNAVAMKCCDHSINLYFVITLLVFPAAGNEGRDSEWRVCLVTLLG